MKAISHGLWWTIVGSGGVALIHEVMIWLGLASAISSTSLVVSYVLVFALVALGGIASLYEESVTVAGPALAWATLPLILGVMCRQLDLGTWQAATQALYGVSLAGCIVWGGLLVKRLERVGSARGRRRPRRVLHR